MGAEQQSAVKTQQATVNEAAKSPPKTEHAEYSMLATEAPPHDFGRVPLHGPPPLQPKQSVAQPTLMRKLTVVSPAAMIPDPTGQGIRQTNAQVVEGYLRIISSSGNATVNRTTGEVSMETGYCPGMGSALLHGITGGYRIGSSIVGNIPVLGQIFGLVGAVIGGLVGFFAGLGSATAFSGLGSSSTPVGSGCLCDFVDSSRETRILIADGVTPAGAAGMVRVPSPNDQRIYGTATVNGGFLDIPPWLILAHELCGHAWRDIRSSSTGEPEEGPEENRAPFVGRDAQGQLEIQEGDPSSRRRASAGQYLRHGATVERENQIRAEHNIPARGYRLRDPYCGESYWRDRSDAAGTMHWQDAQDQTNDTYLQHCEYLRSQLPENRNGRYRIDELIPEGAAAEGVIQRKCDCGGECPKCKAEHAAHNIPAVVYENLHASGHPLDAATRAYFEPRFGHDFSRVKIHNDTRAHTSARAVNAAAYTVGADITFAAGQFHPGTAAGKRLLAHELTHVVQQQHATAVPQAAALKLGAPADAAEQEATQIADTIDQQDALPPVTAQPVMSLARAPFDVDGISAAVNSKRAKEIDPKGPWYPMVPAMPVARLFSDYGMAPPMGEITMAADYPSTFKVPADRTKPVKDRPKADTTVPLTNIPVNAHFFPSIGPAKGKALVIGGFHGDERPGFQATDALVDDLSTKLGEGLAFNTIVIPRLNAAAIQDELDGVRLWRNRCNRQLVDLNRDFPTGETPKDTNCANTGKAPRQPETAALINLIEKFKPDRIVSVHAISTLSSAGIFADPNTSKEAIALARGMASTLVNPSDRPANKLGTGSKGFDATYPLDRGKGGAASAGTSLGAWAPTATAPAGKTTPVITIEAPGFKDLGKGSGDEARTVEGFVRPLRAFLDDPDKLITAADRDILKDIDAFDAADKVAFLTGVKPAKKNDILNRIKFRVDTAIASLNEMKPPVKIKAVSDIRLSTEKFDGNTPQSAIVFEKFFLTGSRAGGWDTLPNNFFKKGDRSKGVDRDKWIATPSKDRLDIILKFSALPGTSRHHWGTEVDLNSTTVTDWKPGKKDSLADLDTWLQANAPKAGLIQSYTAGRKGGYSEEPWHYSYAPIAMGLRERYNKEVNLDKDVRDKITAEFTKRAKAAKQTIPLDFETALKAVDIKDLVNTIGPGL